MAKKHFEAILAKNFIAREIAEAQELGEQVSFDYIISCLKDIEAYIGEGNQPSVEDIINCKQNI